MDGRLLALLIAGLAGSLMALQGSLNSALGRVVGLWEANFIVHLVGTVILSILLFMCRLGDGCFGKIWEAPWYTYVGGLLSVLIIYGVVFGMSKTGVASATTAIIAAQIMTAAVIDHIGFFGLERLPLTWFRGVGMIMLAGGTWLLLKK